jgi:hypothetical protein
MTDSPRGAAPLSPEVCHLAVVPAHFRLNVQLPPPILDHPSPMMMTIRILPLFLNHQSPQLILSPLASPVNRTNIPVHKNSFIANNGRRRRSLRVLFMVAMVTCTTKQKWRRREPQRGGVKPIEMLAVDGTRGRGTGGGEAYVPVLSYDFHMLC